MMGVCSILLASIGFAQEPKASHKTIMQHLKEYKANENYTDLIPYLKSMLPQWTDDPDFHDTLMLELALAYHQIDNQFWAIRTLKQFDEQSPHYTEALSLQVWFAIQSGNFKEARYLLENEQFDSNPHLANRKRLYTMYMDSMEPGTDTNPSVSDSLPKPIPFRIYEEDRSLFTHLVKDDLIHPYSVFELDADISSGLSSNPYLTNEFEYDPSIIRQNVFYWQLGTHIRGIPLSKDSLNLFVEGSLLKNRFYTRWQEPDPAISQFSLNGKLGLTINKRFEFKLYYAPQLIYLEGGDSYLNDGYWFKEEHTLQASLKPIPNWQHYINIAYTAFRETSRTRFGLEWGQFLSFVIRDWVHIYLLGSVIWHQALHPAYHRLNINAAPILAFFKPPFRITLKTMLFWDNYYKSAGYYISYEVERNRMDWEWDNEIQVQLHVWKDLTLSLSYAYNHVFSSVPIYESGEHRAYFMVSYRWKLSSPYVVTEQSGLTDRLTYFEDQEESTQQMQLEELIRREELNRRESSCLNR